MALIPYDETIGKKAPTQDTQNRRGLQGHRGQSNRTSEAPRGPARGNFSRDPLCSPRREIATASLWPLFTSPRVQGAGRAVIPKPGCVSPWCFIATRPQTPADFLVGGIQNHA
jgi:hypothetical protein